MPTASKYYKPYTLPAAPRVRKQDTRATAAERGYDADWARLRRWYIQQHPICEWRGCTQAAAIVDHVLPVDARPDLRLDATNLQSLCRSHHGVKTARDLRCRPTS